jgi:hypothetical protein
MTNHRSGNLLMTVGMSYFLSVCWYPAGIANTESGIGLDEKLLDSMVVSNIEPPADPADIRLSVSSIWGGSLPCRFISSS